YGYLTQIQYFSFQHDLIIYGCCHIGYMSILSECLVSGNKLNGYCTMCYKVVQRIINDQQILTCY
ncbi:hypothetical protein, partial [Anaplasma phagocytophilum]|uniref:hypothetical protein n=1 Tax=Anaplasma phagocytophilum TaxID=948 RepID=UPI00201A88F8